MGAHFRELSECCRYVFTDISFKELRGYGTLFEFILISGAVTTGLYITQT